MKKLLVFGVIALFLGLAIAPSINANIRELSVDVPQENDTLQLESEFQRIRAYIEMQSDEDCGCISESGSDGDFLSNICLLLLLLYALPWAILYLWSPFQGALWEGILRLPILYLGTLLDCYWVDGTEIQE